MEGRKRSGMLKKSVYNMRKRLVAFALAAAMVCTNVGADLNAAYAATSSSESVTFEMTGSQLVTAIEEAIENGNVISPGDLDFTNGDIAKFESLFYGEGKVLEVFPDPDGGSMDAELRVFVRLPEDADDMYMVTGDEEIIFLYVNNGEDTISCSTNITRMEDGVEKVKKTKRITVKSFEAAYGDEEINYISKPVEETTAAAPEDVNGPGTEETTAPDTTAPTDEGIVDDTTTVAPDESADAPTEEQPTAPEEGSTAPTEGETVTSTEAATTEEATTEEVTTEEATDAPEPTEEKTQEAEEADAPEPEAAEPEAAAGEPVASIIRHYAPVVADNEEGNAEEAPKAEEAKEPEVEPEEKTEAVKETEAPTEKETEPAETESTTEAQEGNQDESTTAAPDETTAEAGESTDPSETTTEGTTAAPSESDETTAPETSTDAAETPAATEAVQVGTPSDVTKPEVKPEETVNKASTSDLVGMGYCSTAKVYTTTINQLKALDDFDGYKITYSINPDASARIVDGARGVEEGESLTFGVKNQIGFAIESVTANGEVLVADSIADNEDGSQTAWYTVSDIYEEQEIEVYMTETGEHPAFADSVTIKGVTIAATAPEGVIPIGTRLDVKEVTVEIESAVKDKIEAEEGSEVTSVLAYDINLMLNGNKLDNSWSDNGYVTVTFSGQRIKEKTAEGSAVEIFAVDDINTEELNADTAAEATAQTLTLESIGDTLNVPQETSVNQVSFDAEHFTIYAITVIDPVGPVAVATYSFYVGESAEPVNVQMVKDNESLIEPEVPVDGSGRMFTGWNTEKDGNGDYQTFGEPIEVTASTDIDLYAQFSSAGYVYFLDDNGLIVSTLSGKPGSVISTKGINIATDSDKALVGWTSIPGGTEVEYGIDATVTLDKANIMLYPVIKAVNWVTFESNGGAYIEPVYVPNGGKITRPVPERAGYEFVGWYSDSDLRTEFSFDSTVTSDIILYAKWKGLETTYTLVYWTENADDNGYSYDSTVTGVRGTAGDTVKLTDYQQSYQRLKRNDKKDQKHFKYWTDDAKDKIIEGDGSTVVNIYFTRKIYTLTFKYDSTTVKTISGKYDSYIYDNFPIVGKYYGNDKNFKDYSWKDTGSTYAYKLQTLDKMPGVNVTFKSVYEGSYKTIYYFIEGLQGDETATVSYHEKSFKPYKSVKTGFNFITKEEEFHPIDGFERYGCKGSSDYFLNGIKTEMYFDSKNEIRLYYSRSSYDLTYFNVNNTAKVEVNIPYETDLSVSKYSDYIPPKPNMTEIGPDFVFKGWYTSEECVDGTEFNWNNAKMPLGDMILYAKWAAPEVKVTFHETMDGTGKFIEVPLEYGSLVDSSQAPSTDMFVPEGATFRGWCTKEDEEFKPFNFGTQKIYSDTDLYPTWTIADGYKVVYDLNGGESAETLVDANGYYINARAKVLSADAITPPERKFFTGWKNEVDGKTYYPNDAITISADTINAENTVVLIAQWSEFAKVSLTYEPNGGSGNAIVIEELDNNAIVEIAENTFIAPERKEFKEWNTAADGSGTPFVPGSKALVDKEIPGNVLYAQWDELQYYTVVYTGKSAASGVPPVDVNGDYEAETNRYNLDSTVTVLDNNPDNPLVGNRGGNLTTDFICWTTAESNYHSGIPLFYPGDTFRIEENMIFNPVFAGSNVDYQTISFIAGDNGNLSLNESETEKSYAFPIIKDSIFSKVITTSDDIPNPVPDKNYKFLGWEIEEDGKTVTYANASEIWAKYGNQKVSNNVTFTAKFGTIYDSSYTIWFYGKEISDGFEGDDVYQIKPGAEWIAAPSLGGVTEDGSPIPYGMDAVNAQAQAVLAKYSANTGKVTGLRYPGYFIIYQKALGDQTSEDWPIEFDSRTDSADKLAEIKTKSGYEIRYHVFYDSPIVVGVNYYKLNDDGSKPADSNFVGVRTIEGYHYKDDSIPVVQSMVDDASSIPALDGYKFIVGEPDLGESLSVNQNSHIIKLYFAKDSYSYSVEYYYDGVKGNAPSNEAITGGTGEFGSFARITPSQSVTVGEKNYTLVSKEHSVQITSNPLNNVIRVDYELDENEDDVPDQYQVKVSYTAENGTVSVEGPEYVTIYVDGDVNKGYAKPGTDGAYGTLEAEQIAEATAASGYDQSTELWSLSGRPTQKPTPEMQIREDREYQVTFEKGTYGYEVVKHYTDAEGTEKTDVTKGTAVFDEGILEISGVTVLQNEEYEGKNYTLVKVDGYDRLVTADAKANKVDIYYELDENEDDVPDQYQVKVSYTAENGTVSVEGPEYVTIYVDGDVNKGYAKPGTDGAYGTLEAEQIAEATAASGYDQSTELWSLSGRPTQKPTPEMQIREDREYQVTFEKGTYGYEVVKHYTDAEGTEKTYVTKGTAVFDEGILEISGVTVLQNEEYEGKNYTLVKVDGYDRLVTADAKANKVDIYYELDENEDDVPDQYQVKVSYTAENGTVSVEGPEYVTIYVDGDVNKGYAKPGTDGAYGTLEAEQIAEATAASGYDQSTELWSLSGRPTQKPTPEMQIREDREYQVTFEKGTYGYEVVKHYTDAEGTEKTDVTKGTAVFDEGILEISGVTVLQNEEYEGKNYTLVKVDGYDRLVTADAKANKVDIYYELDENEDDVPDQYQVKVSYTAENGTVSVEGPEYVTIYVDGDVNKGYAKPGTDGAYGTLEAEQIAEATAASGYDQSTELWSLSGRPTQKPTPEMQIREDREYQVTFEKGTYGYEVVKHYTDAEGTEKTDVTKGTAVFDEGILEISGVTVLQNEEYEGKNYTLVKVDGYDRLVTADAKANKVDIYYELDENEDDVPDQYQVKVSYTAENGTVSVEGPEYVTIYVDGDVNKGYAKPGTDGAYGTLEAEQIAEATAASGYDQSTELWSLSGRPTQKPTPEMQIREDREYQVTFEKGTYGYEVVKHYTDAEGTEKTYVTKGTAVFDEGILEISGVTVLQNEEYEGKNYTLVKVDGYDRLVTADAKANKVDIYYELDENEDDVPDQYQVKVSYTAENGTVSVEGPEYVTIYVDGDVNKGYAKPGTDGAYGTLEAEQIAEATAASGYDQSTELWSLSGRPTQKPTPEMQIREDREYQVTFEKGTYGYEVVKHYTDAEGTEKTDVTKGTAVFDEGILEISGVTVLQNEEYEGKNYTLVKVDGYDRLVTADAKANKVDIYYELDENEDDVPDQYQVKVSYTAENGTVSVEGPEYVTIYVDGDVNKGYAKPGTDGAYGTLEAEQIAEATAASGYDQSTELWSLSGRPTQKPTPEMQIREDREYQVTFEKGTYGYEVVKHYTDAEGTEKTDVTKGTAVFDEGILEISGVTVLQNEEYEGKNYTLVKVDGYDRLVTADAEANKVDIYYELDENEDDVPDQYQVKVSYTAENGTVSVEGPEYVTIYVDGDVNKGYAKPGTDGAYGTLEAEQIAEATAASGYDQSTELWSLSGRPTQKPTPEMQIREDREYQVTFEKGTYGYEVVKHYTDAEGTEKTDVTKGTAVFDEGILEISGVTVLQNEEYEGKNYTLVKVDGYDRLVTADAEANKVDIYYELDEKGLTDPEDPSLPDKPDGIPDRYQTVFKYISAGNGSVAGNVYEVHTFEEDGVYTEASKQPVNPIADIRINSNEKFAFDYWTVDGSQKDYNIGMDILKATTYTKDTTFTAYFDTDEKGNGPDGNEPDGVPDKYETIFVYKSADVTKGTVDADPLNAEVHVFRDADGNYTEKTPVSPNGANATALDGFAFDYWNDSEGNDYTPDMSKMKSNTYLVDTTFTAYFDVDEIGTEEPNAPDGVPDKYQIMFQYVSEDTNHGTVSGAVTEVKTIYEIVTGEEGYDNRELRPARPDANVTVSSLGGYSFNNWTDGSRSYANADEIKAAEFTQSTTFTAQFNYNGGGGPSGGGGGGTGGGTTTGGGRYSAPTGGPGSTTITPEDVPLAPLPELPVDVTLIDDGEVPLAPLPKTGQTSMRTTLTMMLSGIFVAVTALSKKRKEEDS